MPRSMEFWGVEVKAGEPLKVELEVGRVLHLSQACLGEVKKDKGHESVYLFVNVDEKKLVLGTLTPEKLPQQIFDLVFDKDFELTHNWKNGSVFFCGYIADNPFEQSEEEDTSNSESEEDVPVIAPNVVPSTQVKQEKPAAAAENANVVKDSAAGKQKVKIVDPNKDMKTDEDEDCSSDEDAISTEDSDDVEDSKDGSDEDDDNDDDTDEEDEQTPQEVQPSKKRAMESAKTPVTDKKAKFVTPQKADGKKGIVHVATPHPSKQSGKTPTNKSNQQTPKSEGSHSCKPCNRSFKSENALESHNKAKHTAGK